MSSSQSPATLIRIGTRDSPLALWQAEKVAGLLKERGYDSELVPLKSIGDLDLNTPLHQFGATGVFTKMLDVALLENQIDIAVHSLKDYPTQTPAGLVMAANLQRGPHHDLLVPRQSGQFLERKDQPGLIATGSIRRVAQWLAKYPQHRTTNLRGNVQTRLRKLKESDWDGAIFAEAGLGRMGLIPDEALILDWMIPAPGQGTVGITCRKEDENTFRRLREINHRESELRALAERSFLRKVEGGCSAPVGAFAEIKNQKLYLKAGVFSLDGKKQVLLTGSAAIEEAQELGEELAFKALSQGAAEIMKSLKNDQ